MKKILLLAFWFHLLGSSSGDVKTWTKNTNFDDPANWNGGGISCTNDRKVFPKEMIVSIYVQKNESLQELVLSDNMILSIGEGVVLSFNTQMQEVSNVGVATPSTNKHQASAVSQQTTTTPPSCISNGRVVKFTAKPASWFNPESWSTPQTTSNESKRFMLDLENIPCSEDRVVFPSKNTFLVDLENSPIRAGAMLVHNEELSSSTSFKNYWEGDVSRYEFVNRPKVTPNISGLPCGDDRTCSCKDRYTHDMRRHICKYVSCDHTLTQSCRNPILPSYGQCCQLCGSLLTLSITASETPSMLYELHRQLLNGLKYTKDVQYSLGPQVNNTMEIIFIDADGTGDSASSVVCNLKDLLLQNETAHVLGIEKVTFERSDDVDHCNIPQPTTLPSLITTPSPKWESIIIAGSLSFAVVCVLIVCLGIYFYRKRYTGTNKNELELGNVSNRSSQGFDNPVYDTPPPFEDSFAVTYDSTGDQVNGFENVLYSPGTDSGVSVHSEKKAPLEDPYAPVVKKHKKNGKKQKEPKNVGFDNPVYSLGGNAEGTGSMVSVPLDEDDSQLPAYVEHDGTGYANPIATGLSEEMMAPALPKKEPINSLQANEGFDNPLFGAESGNGVDGMSGDVAEVTVHVAQPKKKKGKNGKSKEHKSKNGKAPKQGGFDNPMYGQSDDQQDFYQPETPGEDKSKLPTADEDGL